MPSLDRADMGKSIQREIESYRAYEGESLNSILTRILKDDPDIGSEDISGIVRGLADIEAGRVTSHEDVMKEFGLE